MPPRTRVDTLGVSRVLSLSAAFLLICLAVPPMEAREKDQVQYGEGLIVNVPMPEAEVTKVVEDVTQNGIIRGSKEYSRDEFITGAEAATSSRLFPPWAEGGKVFYKIRTHVLDPLNFKDSGDVGTLAVRYVVQPQGDKHTVLRIDAVFVQDFRRKVHASNGSVEGSEYKDIHDRLEELESLKQQAAEAGKGRREPLAAKPPLTSSALPETVPKATVPERLPGNAAAAAATVPPASDTETLQHHVQELRRQVQRLVKAPGAPLKSAPFHTASTLKSLKAGTEVLIVISTPYWFGVETRDGQHGWVPRDQLEQLP